MGSINRSHIETDGGILLFSGELVLLYCPTVDFELVGQSSFKGRVFLTTHRLVIIVNPYRANAPIKSVCAPFAAIVKCNVEQPIFGANYIQATVREEADPNKFLYFKMKFPKGGAIEMAMTMNRAVAMVNHRQQTQPMQAPPAYTPSPAANYYQAPPTVYSPGYDSGIQMPVQQFPDQPPIGFIYASTAPPPYPGLNNPTGGHQPQGSQYPAAGQPQQQPPPAYGANPGYPSASQYPGQQPPHGQGPPPAPGPMPMGASYPGQAPQPGPLYPSASGYSYPNQQQQQHQPSQYPQAHPPSNSGYPMPPGSAPAPGPAPTPSQNSEWPSAPAFNPEWSDDKKKA